MSLKENFINLASSSLEKPAAIKQAIADALNISIEYHLKSGNLIKAEELVAKANQLWQEDDQLLTQYEQSVQVFVPSLFGVAEQKESLKPGRPPILEEILISQLQGLALKLGRTPSSGDMTEAYKRKEIKVTAATFVYRFGSITQARMAADLPPLKSRLPKQVSVTIFHDETQPPSETQTVCKKLIGRRVSYTQQDLIGQIENLSQQLGRRPITKDIQEASKHNQSASVTTFLKAFGSMKNIPCSCAIIQKTEDHDEPIRPKKRDDRNRAFQTVLKEIIDSGRKPKIIDLKKAHKQGKCASCTTFFSYFGSMQGALHEIDPLKYPAKKEVLVHSRVYSRGEMVDQLKKLFFERGRALTRRDLASTPASAIGLQDELRDEFGSLSKALKAAGVSGKTAMITELQNLYQNELNGQTPTAEQLQRLHKQDKCSSPGSMVKVFGSINQAFQEAGIPVVRERKVEKQRYRRKPYSDQELFDALRQLQSRLGRTIRAQDIVEGSKSGVCACFCTYINRFGSLRQACAKANLNFT